jgi:hypothetical protein
MHLFYDAHDLPHAGKLHDGRFQWLQELGAVELNQADRQATGFLFGYQQGIEHLRQQVADRPLIRDRPEEREELIRLDTVLGRLDDHQIQVPSPRTWILRIDDGVPADLRFPLFVRTPTSSWKRGGQQGKVRNLRELSDEVELLRRAFGWDLPILAREWLHLAVAGTWMFGAAPQEVRVWIVDGQPAAWSFHYLHAVPHPKGFPPSRGDLALLADLSAQVARPFRSRLIAADFVRTRQGKWYFLEAGPGAAAGTAHESVFKRIARRLLGVPDDRPGDAVGGPLEPR